MLASFYRRLYACKLRGEGKDKLWWLPSRKGIFEVKSYYRELSPRGSLSFPWKSVWRSQAPLRVAFFIWTAVRSKILTLDNLGMRGMIVVNRCWLCEMEGESVDHLLLHCVVACGLWNAFFSRFGLCWVMPRSVKQLLVSWWLGGHTRSAVVGKMALIVLCGVFGVKETIDVSRTCRGLERRFSIFFSSLFTLGPWAG